MEESLSNEVFTVLVIDDEKSIRSALGGVLSDEGCHVVTARSAREGIVKFEKHRPEIVFLDVWMNGMDGIEALQELKDLDAQIPVVIMSGHSTIETAVRATKLGAFDFLEKPLSLEKILPILDHAKSFRLRENPSQEIGEVLIGSSLELAKINKQVSLVAPRNAWVLVTGENGTGKEVIARKIHQLSGRAVHPFVAVNCAAIPESLIESELFGHTKGAFTNALRDKPGKFEQANKGTLFLDEIGDMSLKTQAKILRILQDQKYEKVGGTETYEVDVRVIAATNKDLKIEMKMGRFREDLYYRLNVIPFHLPPLRDRGDDIGELTEYFLCRIAEELGESRKFLSPEAEIVMRQYKWPGNVRELRNILERLCILVTDTVIKVCDLDALIDTGSDSKVFSQASNAVSLKEAKTVFEKAFILEKLEENQWNVTKTAEVIGVERSHLYRKLRGFDIDAKQLKG